MFALQPELKVFTGSANRDLAERICKYIGVPLGQATISSFPDGETYVRIEENIRGHDVFIIQPTCPPTNEHLMELLIMVDAARRASADRITAVIPFSDTRARTAKISRASRSRPNSWPICLLRPACIAAHHGPARATSAGFFSTFRWDHLYRFQVLIKYCERSLPANDGGFSRSRRTQNGFGYAEALGANLAIVAKERRSATETGPCILSAKSKPGHSFSR
jgi:ribose-phosphate pyrophosphokinase